LIFRFGDGIGDLAQITPEDIIGFMRQLVSRGKPLRDKTPPTHLRNFFQFLSAISVDANIPIPLARSTSQDVPPLVYMKDSS